MRIKLTVTLAIACLAATWIFCARAPGADPQELASPSPPAAAVKGDHPSDETPPQFWSSLLDPSEPVALASLTEPTLPVSGAQARLQETGTV